MINARSDEEVSRVAELLKTLSLGSSAQVVDNQKSSTAASTAAPVQQQVKETSPAPAKEIVKEEEEDDLLGDEETIDKDSIRALAAEKAKGGHRDAIKNKLTELKAASVSAVAEKDFKVFYNFLKGLE